jgi:hypothetical protein
LGGFRNLAQHHDISQPVTVRVDFSPGNDPLPTYGQLTVNEAKDSDLRKDLAQNGLGGVETAWVKATCQWHEDEESRRPWITHYEIGLNGRRIAEISTQPPHTPCITFLDFDHPLFIRFDEAEGVTSQQDQGTRQSLKSLARGLHLDPDTISPVSGIQLWLGKSDSAIPDFSESLPIADDIVDDEERPTFDVFAFLTNQILVGTGELLLRQLRRIRYLGPIREVPPRNFLPRTSPEESRWANGLAAWDTLYSRYNHAGHAGDEFFKSVSRVMSADDELGLGYSMELAEIYEVRDDSVIMNHLRMLQSQSEGDAGELFRAPVVREMERLLPQRRLILHDEVNDTDVKPQDIGVGVSQVLPVVVGAMEPRCSLFAVEQPELHIHPRIQCNLGDVFAREANQNDGRIFLIETHSEHLILRLLRRIRETTEGELPPGKPALKPEHVAVYYIEGGPEGMKATPIAVTDDGDFSTRWPAGFFPERVEELM